MRTLFAGVCCLATVLFGPAFAPAEEGFVPLFPNDGVPEGWRVVVYHDVSQPATNGAVWRVENGVLQSGLPRGTFLMSPRAYGDFVLRFDFKLPARGNSGIGLRLPERGDPAFDGLEVQLADPRYYGDDPYGIDQLTGAIYPAIAASKQVYRPEDWNHMEITCDGPLLRVVLNATVIQDVNLDEQDGALERGEPLAKRPRRGPLGFQELSRGEGQAQFRKVEIKELRK